MDVFCSIVEKFPSLVVQDPQEQGLKTVLILIGLCTGLGGSSESRRGNLMKLFLESRDESSSNEEDDRFVNRLAVDENQFKRILKLVRVFPYTIIVVSVLRMYIHVWVVHVHCIVYVYNVMCVCVCLLYRCRRC